MLEPSSRILIVEDDAVIADMLQELLVGAGYQVLWAPDVIAALSALERNRIDLITLDIELGTYSGQGLLALLKTDAHTRSIPVIVISSSPAGPDVRRLADHILSKPFSITPLVQAIASYLTPARRAAALDPWPETVDNLSPELEVAREVLD